MTTYRTGNPVGSTKPKDLYDNAENLDFFVNGPNPFYPDRLNKLRLSWSGIEESYRSSESARESQFQDIIARGGYQVLGDYAAGLTFTSYMQVVIRNGLAYRLAYTQPLPYTLTGTWATDSAKLLLVGDAGLRQELANADDTSKGATLVAGTVREVDTVAQLLSLPKGKVKYVHTNGYAKVGDGGDGFYYRDDSDTTSVSNGITLLVSAAGDRYRLNHDGKVDLFQAGCLGDGTTDNTSKLQALIDLAAVRDEFYVLVPLLPQGYSFRVTSTLVIKAGVSIRGEGCEPHSLVTQSGQNTRGSGSWLFLDHTGKGFTISASDSSSAPSASSGVRFSGIGTLRNHTLQSGSTATFAPTVCDYDFDINNADVTLENVTTLNPYRAVHLINGSFGRLTIRGLRGQPLSVGINIEESYDTCRIQDVQFWPFWSHDQRVWNYTLANLRAYMSGRNDNPFYQNIFSIFHNIGFNIYGISAGTTNKAKIFGADIDRGMYGMVQDASSDGASALFVGFSAQGESGVVGNNSGILMSGTNGEFTFDSPDLRLYNANCIRVLGTANTVVVSNPKMASFNKAGTGFPAIEVGTNNRVDVVGRPRIGDANGGNYYGGAGILKAPGEWGSASGTTDAAGQIIVTHGAGFTPRQVWIELTGGGNGATSQVISKTSTTFTVALFNGTAALVNTAVSFDWEVKP